MKTHLIDLLNKSNYDFYFLVVDKSLDIKLPILKNFYNLYAPENIKNSGVFLSQKTTQEFIIKNSQKTKKQPAIISFKPSPKIDLICKKNNWIKINNDNYLNRLLEDKIKFLEICKKNNIPTIPSEINTFNQKNYLEYQNKFNKKLVIQTHFGWAGNSTFYSESWEDIKDKIAPDINVKFSPFLAGYTLLNNCCLTKFGLIQSPPALQFTGIKPFTDNPFTTVGRQWPSLASKNIQNQIKKITENFGEILKQYNYRGFFGLDFLVANNQVFLLECNPRLTASFAFYTSIELKNNINPLFLFHLAEFINLDYQINIKEEKNRFDNQNLIGSELVKKDKNSHTVKKFNDFIIFSESLNPIKIDPKIINKLS